MIGAWEAKPDEESEAANSDEGEKECLNIGAASTLSSRLGSDSWQPCTEDSLAAMHHEPRGSGEGVTAAGAADVDSEVDSVEIEVADTSQPRIVVADTSQPRLKGPAAITSILAKEAGNATEKAVKPELEEEAEALVLSRGLVVPYVQLSSERPDARLRVRGARPQPQGHERHDSKCDVIVVPLRAPEAEISTARPNDSLVEHPAASGEVPLVRSTWNSKSGYKNVTFNGSWRAAKRPWQARTDDGKSLGTYTSPEEAAAAYSRHLGLDVAGQLAAIIQQQENETSMTSEEALRTAASEGLTLLPAKREGKGSTPYRGVYRLGDGPRSFLGRLHTDGKKYSLGCFFTAEEAALELARFRRKLEHESEC